MTRDLKVQICAAAVHEASRALDPKLPAWAKVQEEARAAAIYAVEAALAGEKPQGPQPSHLRQVVASMARIVDLPHAPLPREEPEPEVKPVPKALADDKHEKRSHR